MQERESPDRRVWVITVSSGDRATRLEQLPSIETATIQQMDVNQQALWSSAGQAGTVNTSSPRQSASEFPIRSRRTSTGYGLEMDKLNATSTA